MEAVLISSVWYDPTNNLWSVNQLRNFINYGCLIDLPLNFRRLNRTTKLRKRSLKQYFKVIPWSKRVLNKTAIWYLNFTLGMHWFFYRRKFSIDNLIHCHYRRTDVVLEPRIQLYQKLSCDNQKGKLEIKRAKIQNLKTSYFLLPTLFKLSNISLNLSNRMHCNIEFFLAISPD